MPCYRPLRRRVHSRAGGAVPLPIDLPCGQCIGCKLERSRQHAVRCMHETQSHEVSSFLTLTYSPESLPPGGSLEPEHLERFWKRLRKRFPPRTVSYFACGEYGERLLRPHYHAIAFGVDFSDKKLFKRSKDGSEIFTSKQLEEIWTYGFCTLGAVTFESAAYVARYALKKITGKKADDHYRFIDDDGVVHRRHPEFLRSSNRPAPGKRWFMRFRSEVFPQDEVIVRGHQASPPRYYMKLQQQLDAGPYRPGELPISQLVQRKRIETISRPEVWAEGSTKRLRAREEVSKARLSTLRRDLEK